MSEIIAPYKERYGAWAGFPKGHKPDFQRCCESVWRDRTPGGSQCNRKRGFGPDKAYCKQHDPESVKARAKESERKFNEELNAKRYQWSGRTFFDALQKIAEGHNDARGLAQSIIDEFKAGERPSPPAPGRE